MISKEDLEKRYANLSINELMDIIEDKHSYTELAVQVAFEEISRRKISEEDIKNYKNRDEEKVKSFINKNIFNDLTYFQKNIFFFIWIPFLNFPLKRVFFDEGYVLKIKQANYYSWLGFSFCLIISIIETKYNFSNYYFFIFWMISFLVAYFFDEKFNRQSQIKRLQRIFNLDMDFQNEKKLDENEF